MKTLSRDQLEKRKEKAARFVEDVLGDPDRADEIRDEGLEVYAERRKLYIAENPIPGGCMSSKAELLERVKELEEENDELQDQLDEVADIVAPVEDETEDGDEEDESGEE